MLTPWSNGILGYLEAVGRVVTAPVLGPPVEAFSRIAGPIVGGDIGSARTNVALLLNSLLLGRALVPRIRLLVTALGVPLTGPSILQRTGARRRGRKEFWFNQYNEIADIRAMKTTFIITIFFILIIFTVCSKILVFLGSYPKGERSCSLSAQMGICRSCEIRIRPCLQDLVAVEI